jgi:predicted membrane-bound spermidine synthase
LRRQIAVPLRFLQPASLPALGVFDRDIARTVVSPSSLDHPTILNYYEREARKWE